MYMDLTDLHLLSASEAARLIRDGVISSEQFVEACLARITRSMASSSWAFLDPEYALTQARAADQRRLKRRDGRTAARRARRHQGYFRYRRHADGIRFADLRRAHAVARCHRRGLNAARGRRGDHGQNGDDRVCLFSPGKTRNPHNREHTPGGSSSGSAAAVGANMVPLAIGSQTNGSTIRPAAYCGVVGFKPTHGLISRHRVFAAVANARSCRVVRPHSVDDIALLAEQLVAYDENDPDTQAARADSVLHGCRRRAAVGADVRFHQDADVATGR